MVKERQPFAQLAIMIQMEYAEGLTLKEYVEAENFSISRQEIFNLFIQLMNALKHIHSEGLVHRDIKPENIFINPNS